VGVESVLHPLTLLPDVHDRCGNITSTAEDALVVESTVGKQKVDLEGIRYGEASK
jgi:hypothetical protein